MRVAPRGFSDRNAAPGLPRLGAALVIVLCHPRTPGAQFMPAMIAVFPALTAHLAMPDQGDRAPGRRTGCAQIASRVPLSSGAPASPGCGSATRSRAALPLLRPRRGGHPTRMVADLTVAICPLHLFVLALSLRFLPFVVGSPGLGLAGICGSTVLGLILIRSRVGRQPI